MTLPKPSKLADYAAHPPTVGSWLFDLFGTPDWTTWAVHNVKGHPNLTAWQILWRCPCGTATRIALPTSNGATTTGNHRWLCPDCGRDAAVLIQWIGRWWGSDTRVEWQPWEKLPDDLQRDVIKALGGEAKATTPTCGHDAESIEREIEARVKARVEVEVVALKLVALEAARVQNVATSKGEA